MSPDQPSEREEPGEESSEHSGSQASICRSSSRKVSACSMPTTDSDELETEDESLLESIEEEPRTVLITGACGNIGRKLRSAWADVYDLVLIDRAADPKTTPRSSWPT